MGVGFGFLLVFFDLFFFVAAPPGKCFADALGCFMPPIPRKHGVTPPPSKTNIALRKAYLIFH